MFAEVLMIMREWLCLVSEWSHAASHNHCYLHKETGYFGEETLRACDKSCSALRDVWELSLPMVWPLMAAQVSPRLVVTLLKVGFTHPGSRGHGHLFLKCWQDCSPSFTKKTKTALNICFISFPCSFIFFFFLHRIHLLFSAVLFYYLLFRQHFPSTEDFCCQSLWWCPQMVLPECYTWCCGFCTGALQFSHIQKLSCLPVSLQLAANCPQINGGALPPNGTAWIKVLSLAGVDKCHSSNPWSALCVTSFCVLLFLSHVF